MLKLRISYPKVPLKKMKIPTNWETLQHIHVTDNILVSRAKLQNLGTGTLLGQILPCSGSCPAHDKLFTIISGLSLPDASSSAPRL